MLDEPAAGLKPTRNAIDLKELISRAARTQTDGTADRARYGNWWDGYLRPYRRDSNQGSPWADGRRTGGAITPM